MSEFMRTIDHGEFQDGIARRLLVGQVAVGGICKVRFQDMIVRPPTLPAVRHVEATVSILEKQELTTGSTVLRYIFESTRDLSEPVIYTDTFGPDSLALNHSYGLNLLTYLSDDTDPRWDDSLHALVDVESDMLVR